MTSAEFGTGTAAAAAAAESADDVAREAGVHVREVDGVDGVSAIAAFFAEVWRTPPGSPPYPAELLHSVVHAGGCLLGAFDEKGQLAGATAAVFGAPADRTLYSLVAAARASDRGVGYALKHAQRKWALERGATTMTWTFDPLVGRNARFNLAKLGAYCTEYLVDFYGPMQDGVNDSDESDRLTATWDLLGGGHTGAPGAGAQHGRGEAVTDRLAPDGGPLTVRAQDGRIWCRVPRDIVALREEDPDLALRWRHAVRQVLVAAFADGCAATWMERDGWYLLTPGHLRREHAYAHATKNARTETPE